MTSSLIDRSETVPALSQDDECAIDRVVQVMSKARRLLFITGAGMSADSGLPTYRGRDGIYRAQQTTSHGLSIEQALSGPMLQTRPEITWHYLLELEKTSRHAAPNRGHHVIAEMDGYFDAVWILTQNVDGLHQRRLAQRARFARLLACARVYVVRPADYGDRLFQADTPPRCSDCGGPIRPQVVLFEEELPYDKLSRLWYELGAGFDLIFSIGTSNSFEYIVEPVRVGRSMGITTVEINPEITTISSEVDVKITTGAAAALDSIWERYLAWWPWS